MFFHVITKNLNWEILTKNLVTFKRSDGVKDEKIFTVGSRKTNIQGGIVENYESLDILQILRDLGKRKRDSGVFQAGV